MDLRSRFDQILKVCAGEEVSEVNKFAVIFVLNVNDTPPVLTAADLLASNDDRLL